MIDEIGNTAGKIWSYLSKNGEATINKLSQEVGEPERAILMGIGWLAREDKLAFISKGRFKYIALKDAQPEQTVLV